MLSENERERYTRQLIIDGWGIEAQETLKNLKVFVAGAGGSGSPIITQLALLGVGYITVCDYDTVELSNLNRQFIHCVSSEHRIGLNKAVSAKMTIENINPHINVQVYQEKIDENNIDSLVGDAQILFDCVDDISVKFILSKCAVRKNIPHLFYGMMDINSFACIFYPPHTPCFHCLFDYKKVNEAAEYFKHHEGKYKTKTPVCCPPVIASAGFAVTEALKILLGIGEPAYNKFFLFLQKGNDRIVQTNGYLGMRFWVKEYFKKISLEQGFDWNNAWRGKFIEELDVVPDPDCNCCGKKSSIKMEQHQNEKLEEIIFSFNRTSLKYDSEKTICQLFETQVERSPEKIAVECENKSLTYRELNTKSNQLADVLISKGVSTGSIVGLLMERSVDMIVGIMGVLKAGGAYLPLTGEYPVDSISYMLQKSGADILVAHKHLMYKVNFKMTLVDINDFVPSNNPTVASRCKADDTAYVIYTSGSTGKPKGVEVSHRNVLNLIAGLNKAIYEKYNKALRIALVAPFSFDASVKQIFASLLMGHTLVIAPTDTRSNGKRLFKFYNNYSIDISDGTPMHLQMLTDVARLNGEKITVKQFIIGGDALKLGTLKEFCTIYKDEKPLITNIYGLTECCVDSTAYTIDLNNLGKVENIPIGRPMANQQVYILDESLKLVSVGAIGDIYISGHSVGKGYINDKNLTSERFIPDPFNKGGIMYRTGDLGKWHRDGNIEFMGRSDYQVKINGHRVELAEIEYALCEHPDIKEAVVISKTDQKGDKFLCAYIVSQEEIVAEDIKNYMREKLPIYMVPLYYVKTECLPLTKNGKIDRKFLEKWDVNINSGLDYAPPENDFQKRLVEIWEKVLGLSGIGVDSDFFDLGGNSLLAIKLEVEMEKNDIETDELDIYQFKTIRSISKLLEEKG